MCGRFVVSKADGDLVAALGIDVVVGEELRPNWNVAPTQQVRIVTGRGPDGAVAGRRLETARWGLVPVWAKSKGVGARAINCSGRLADGQYRGASVRLARGRLHRWTDYVLGLRASTLRCVQTPIEAFATRGSTCPAALLARPPGRNGHSP
ncbi:SOS response-associated peptidase family protein [Arthrobacter halodurans]|uniref:SOS response-associated peptidase family protein n=1 Tax=Arthrobacter halodurans TaxID=516699 RepID=A0ABV4UKX4_9MICC